MTYVNFHSRGVATLDAVAAKARMAALDAPPRIKLREHIRAAAAAGVRPTAVFRDLGMVMRGPGRLTMHEYFYFRMYDPAFPQAELRRHVGKRRQQAFHMACNDPHWFAAARDKALFYAAALGNGLPVPKTVAVYAPGGCGIAAETLRTPQELAAFLRRSENYPMFLKPIDGIYSVGALSLTSLDGGYCSVNGATAELDAVIQFMLDYGGEGFLLQQRLYPHPVLRHAFGDTLATVRCLVLLGPAGAAIESAVLKIPSRRNPADNYWRSGNMLGALDETGTIRRAITGVGLALHEVKAHPDTGVELAALSVPDWQEAIDLCRRAAAMFVGIRTQSWDIAITDAGPVVVELNFGGDLNLHQLAHRRGALTPAYVEHLKRCGYRGLKQ